jgi:hypothetical protein
MRGSLAVVGVFGLLVGLATFFVVTLQREEIVESKNELDAYKVEAGERISVASAAGETAKADVAKANAEITEAKRQTAVLEKDAAEARLEQERLKAQLAWRSLSPAAFARLVEVLSSAKGSVVVGYIQHDPESLAFAIQIGKVFDRLNRDNPSSSPWSVQPDPRTYPDRLVFGLFIPGRFCCKSRLKRLPNSDSVSLMQTSAGSGDDGTDQPGSRAAILFI